MKAKASLSGVGGPLPRRDMLRLLAAGSAAVAVGGPRPGRADERRPFEIRATQECGWNAFFRKGFSTDPEDIAVNFRHLDHLREAGLNWLLVFWTNAPEFREAWRKAAEHARSIGLHLGRAIYGFGAGGPEWSMAEPGAPDRLLRPSSRGPKTALCPNEPEAREWMAGILADRLEPGIEAIVIEPARETGRNCVCEKCRAMRPFEWDAFVINFLAERLVRLKPDVKIMLHLSAVNTDRAAKRRMALELAGLPKSVAAMFAWGIDDEAAVTDWLDAGPRTAAFTKLSRAVLFPEGVRPAEPIERRAGKLFRWCRLAADKGKTAYSFDWRLFGGREWKGHENEPPTTRRAPRLPASIALMGAALNDPYLDERGQRDLLAGLRAKTEWDLDDPEVFYRGTPVGGARDMSSLKAEFKKIDITPHYPVSLAGYFNERISDGVLDPLQARLAAFELGGRRLLFIQVDSCAISVDDADDIRSEIARRGPFQKSEIMLLTSHIHTGPDLVGFFGMARDERYLADLKRWLVEAAAAMNPRGEVSVSIAKASYEGLAFNRRWWMKNGTVVTNPPKKSPDRRSPEGPVDREANAVVFRDGRGALRALFVNISNHTDTVGGTKITADWPGFMERRLDGLLGADVPVFPLIAPQGNINHLEFESLRPQTNYEEAERLGRAYAEIVAASLPGARPLTVERLEAAESVASIPSRDVSEADLREARQTLERAAAAGQATGRDLTAEDLAKGDIAVEALFARELIRFAGTRPPAYRVPLQVLKLGGVAFAAIPGEPFVEVGLALKAVKGYDLVVPVALANGYVGYIALAENFGRGGYETRAGAASYLGTDAADRILAALRSLL